MILGQRMVRLSDGMKGVVQQNGPELRIFWTDRGEELMAAKSEKWEPDELKVGGLKPSERFLIAAEADRVLRLVEKNEPYRWWEKPPLTYQPYDADLMQLIEDYLEKRGARSAA